MQARHPSTPILATQTAWGARHAGFVLALGGVLALGLCGSAHSQTSLVPLAGNESRAPAPWRLGLLPDQKKPITQFSVETLDGVRALRIEADHSYGNLVHPVRGPLSAARALQWRWRLDDPLARPDLHTRSGDDSALKVCVLFDMPLGKVPFFERQVYRLIRSRTGEDLPTATLCYIWDQTLPVGTLLPNAFTRRVRDLIAEGEGTPLKQWRGERRDLRADFLRAFGDESSEVPPIIAVLVGADADNTADHSVGYVTDLQLLLTP